MARQFDKVVTTASIFLAKHYAFLIIIAVCIVLRAYRINELTTFGGDQGQDFLVVRDMVLYHKWTLLGIKTSIADFFQGPVYLYMLFPLFWLLRLNPIAGALTALSISVVTCIALYLTGVTFFSKKTALLSSAIFTLSPQFVRYGNTPLYQHFLPLFIVLSIFLYLCLERKKVWWIAVLLGLSVGIGMELHFLNITLALTLFIVLLIKEQRVSQSISYIGGILLGLSPTIVFELRHDFLNIHLFLTYLASRQGTAVSGTMIISQWIQGAGNFLAGNNPILGVLVLVFTGVTLWLKRIKKNESYSSLKLLAVILTGVLMLFSMTVSGSQAHYLLPLWVVMLLLLPLLIEKFIKNSQIAMLCIGILLFINFFSSVKQLNNNHGYDMPEGWTLKKAVMAGEIIARDGATHPNFNVAFLLDGNTRSYPLRFVVATKGQKAQHVDKYPESDYLYVISDGNEKKLNQSQVWEVASLQPFTIVKKWDIKEAVFLYRLDRSNIL